MNDHEAETGAPPDESVEFEGTVEVEEDHRDLRYRIRIDLENYDPRRREEPVGLTELMEQMLAAPISQSIDDAYRSGLQDGLDRAQAKAEWAALAAIAGAAGFSSRIQATLEAAVSGEETIGVFIDDEES